MFNRFFLNRFLMVAMFAALLVQFGCASSGTSTMSSLEKQVLEQAISENKSPEEMIELAEKRLVEAKEAGLDFYSPKFYGGAMQLLKEARQGRIEGAKSETVILKTIKSQKMVDSAFATKKVVMDLLSIALSEKELLDELEAATHFPEEYAKTMDLFKQINTMIEDKKLEEATGRQSQLTDATSALLVKTLEKIILTESKEVLASARENQAKTHAPKTYMEAELLLKRASTFISTYPRDRKGIEKIGGESLNASKHAYYVSSQVKTLAGLDNSAIEDFVLDLEAQLLAAGSSMGKSDIQYMPLSKQAAALKGVAAEIAERAKRVEGLEENNRSLELQVEDLKKKFEELNNKAGEVEGLISEREENGQVISGLKKSNEQLKKDIEEVKQALLLKNSESEKLMAEKRSIVYDLKNLKIENVKLKKEVSGLEAGRDKSLDELARLKDKNVELEKRIARQKAELSRAKAAVSEAAAEKS